MNYLAHLFLSPPGEDALLGSMLGDFVKGPLTNGIVQNQYGDEITKGIALHRKVDSFTDAHPVVRDSWKRVSTERRRFAGIMVDMFYDHFLAKHWETFHHQILAQFTDHFYAILVRRHDELPERLQRMTKSMVELDWLGSYAQVDSIDSALNRMSRRLRRSNALVNSAEELLRNYDQLEQDFLRFIPDAVEFSRQWSATESRL